jgi:hypothetical protein
VNIVEVMAVIPAAMDDVGSHGVADLNLVVDVLLVFGIRGKEVRYAIAKALADSVDFLL